MLVGTTALRIRQVSRERAAEEREPEPLQVSRPVDQPGGAEDTTGTHSMSDPATDVEPADSRPTDRQARSRLISSGAVMAAGTAFSRLLGFGRFVLLVILFGNGTRQADMFTLANTVPNSMYILLAGGVLNTVLVPQIVRAVKTGRGPGRGLHQPDHDRWA